MDIDQDLYHGDMWNVTGPGHEAYNDFRKHMGEYRVDTSAYGHGVVETVDLSLVDGICLSGHDIADPGVFWSQHRSDGTMDFFLEIAAHIPEVKERLDSGVPLSDLEADPVLGDCASIYFNPHSPSAPTLVKRNGFYEFQSNGRHRIIAARILGHSFPMRIVGELVRK